MKFDIAVVKISAESNDTRCLYLVDGKVLVNDYDEGSDDSDFMFGQFAKHFSVEVCNHPIMSKEEFYVKWPKNADDPLI